MDKFSWRTLIVFLFSLIELCTSQAPSLARALLPSYRVNPSTSPFFPYCSFNGDPTPQISWSFEGQMLPTDSSQGGPYYIPATGVLVLSGASSGMYTCTGMNQLGMDSQTITITIVGQITTAPWYLMPYMWFVYILIVWAICVVLMVLLFCYKKKRAEAGLAPVVYPWLPTRASGNNYYNSGIKSPDTWDDMPSDSPVVCVDLKPDGIEYNEVLVAFNKSMSKGNNYTDIVRIQQIQNPKLYSSYAQAKEQMSKTNPPNHQNERQLFHGTDISSVNRINTNGFNRTFAGKHAKVYGVGTYFARDASYSASSTYSQPDSKDQKYIYLARALVGEYTVGSSSMEVPPAKDPQKNVNVLFDSLVNNTSDPTIFVVGPDAHSYPEYLITFKG